MDISRDITAVILAGGRGRRMGGRDKGLVPVGGRPLVAHVIDAVAPQVAQLQISANRNREKYAEFGCPVLADPLDDYQGPLAGILAAMKAARTLFLVTLPCDGPLLGPDMVKRLSDALLANDAEIAVAHDGERLQPVYALIRTALLPSLQAYLAGGDRKIDLWYGKHHWVAADFSDVPEQFANVNTPEDLERFEGAGRNPGAQTEKPT